MRKIKFRAWDPSEDVMRYDISISCDGVVESSWGKDKYDWIPLQFTGKHDCKGKEVYEGDIVEFDRDEWGGDDNIHVVSWSEDDAEWCWGGGTASDMEWRTVIGNIYEDADLLKR